MKKLDKKYLIYVGIIFIIFGIILYVYFNKENNSKTDDEFIVDSNEIITTEEVKSSSFYVDVKGSVKKPGVYEFVENERVIDAINKAGGLTSSADTSNINLSQKLKSEMVVYVYSKKEVKNASNKITCDTKCETTVLEVNNCVSNNSDNNSLININTATEEDLLTLPGIGASKAKSIIEYRNINGNFKSIEDLKNISGIGDSLFNQIKDKITV